MCVCVYVCSRVRSRTENGRKEEEEDGGVLPAKIAGAWRKHHT